MKATSQWFRLAQEAKSCLILKQFDQSRDRAPSSPVPVGATGIVGYALQYASLAAWLRFMQTTTSPGRSPRGSDSLRCLMIGCMFERLTRPQPVWVQGATGEIGMVPEVGSQPRSGYHAERLSASLILALSIKNGVPSD